MTALDAVARGPAADSALRPLAARTLIALTFLAVMTAGCKEAGVNQVRPVASAAARCDAEPLGAVIAFLPEPDEIGAFRIDGTVRSVPTTASMGLGDLVIHDAKGVDHTLTFQVPEQTLPVREGGSYSFIIEHVGRFPAASALLVSDENGLLFAGVSDIGVASMVLKNGIEGFEFQLLPSTCESRAHSDCYDALSNAPLRVTRGQESADLFNRESADLGGYRVTCLTAEAATPSGRCADAGRLTVSYTLQRLAPNP